MPLPGFKGSVQLTQEPPRLTDKLNGRSLTLSRGEAKLLSYFDGQRSHEELARLAQADGFPVESTHVAGLLERVAHAGFMDGPPPELTPRFAELELPTDKVPSLRPDLQIKRADKGGTMEVKDPVRGQSFSLYDFEVSIARMLNGKRTAAQVIEAAAKIGIPVSLESLRKFIRQLRAYHFIAEEVAPEPPTDGGTWTPRSSWTPEVRELFQSALRHFRAGKFNEASEYIVALMQIDPGNKEAAQLGEQIHARRAEEPVEGMNFDELHGGADAAPDFMDASEPPQIAAPGSFAELTPPSGPHKAAQLPHDQRKGLFDFKQTSLTPETGRHAAASSEPARDFAAPLELTAPTEEKKAWRPTTLEFRAPDKVEEQASGPELLDTGAASASADEPLTARHTPWPPSIVVPDTGARDVIPDAAFNGPVSDAEEPVAPPAARPLPANVVPPMADPETAPRFPDEESSAASAPRRKRKWGLLLIPAAVIVLAGVALAFPVKTTATVPAKLEPSVQAKVTADHELVIEKLLVDDGASVTEGQDLAALDSSEAKELLQSADAREQKLKAQLAALDRKVNKRAKLKADAAVAKAQKTVDGIDKQKSKLEDLRSKVDLKKPAAKKFIASIDRKLKLLAKSRTKAQAKLNAAERAQAKLTNGAARQPIEAQLELVRADREKAKALSAAAAVKSPAAGTWRASISKPLTLAAGETLGVVYHPSSLRLTAKLPEGASADGAQLHCGKVSRVVAIRGSGQVETTVENKDGALSPGSCTLEIAGGTKPLASALFAKK